MASDETMKKDALPAEIDLDETDYLKSELFALRVATIARDQRELSRRAVEARAALDQHVKEMSAKYNVDMNLYVPRGTKAVLQSAAQQEPKG